MYIYIQLQYIRTLYFGVSPLVTAFTQSPVPVPGPGSPDAPASALRRCGALSSRPGAGWALAPSGDSTVIQNDHCAIDVSFIYSKIDKNCEFP